MVNKANVQRVIEAIFAEEQASFDMRGWIAAKDLLGVRVIPTLFVTNAQRDEPLAPCNTAACIGGFCDLLIFEDNFGHAPANKREIGEFWNSERKSAKGPSTNRVAKFLGIDNSATYDLCFPQFLSRRTKAEAIRVLETLRDTGEVKWENPSD